MKYANRNDNELNLHFPHKHCVGYEFFDNFRTANAAVANLAYKIEDEAAKNEMIAMAKRIEEIGNEMKTKCEKHCEEENAKTIYTATCEKHGHRVVIAKGTEAEVRQAIAAAGGKYRHKRITIGWW